VTGDGLLPRTGPEDRLPPFRRPHARVAPAIHDPAADVDGAPIEQVYASATFDKTWFESVGDERVTARHYGAGHTSGDSIIHFERAQIVHMGDLLFHECHPFIDRAPQKSDCRRQLAARDRHAGRAQGVRRSHGIAATVDAGGRPGRGVRRADVGENKALMCPTKGSLLTDLSPRF
jgi:glyoxylase-like metal-dependent hydrolase (beta-lactamase superfamily II)